jgi:hypothetical protein
MAQTQDQQAPIPPYEDDVKNVSGSGKDVEFEDSGPELTPAYITSIISELDMTNRYTDEEWTTQIERADKELVIEKKRLPVKESLEGLAKTVDHTLLKLEATATQIDAICAEARRDGFKVCPMRFFCHFAAVASRFDENLSMKTK